MGRPVPGPAVEIKQVDVHAAEPPIRGTGGSTTTARVALYPFAVADLLLPDPQRARFGERVRASAHPLLGSTAVTVALVVVGVASIFVPVVGILAIAVVTTVLLHAAIRAAVNR